MKTIVLILLSFAASAQTVTKKQYDSLYTVYRKQKVSDSLQLKEANFRVNRVRYYIKIVTRNPSQKKFFLGWVRRAVEE